MRFPYSGEQPIGLVVFATIMTARFFAALCILFGVAVSAFVPATLEQKIGNLLLFGLMPAIGLYAAGHILGQLLGLVSELCDKLATRFFRCSARLLIACMTSLSGSISNSKCVVALGLCRLKIFNVARKAYHSTHRHCSHARAGFIELLCLLIRSAAKLVIRMQAFYQRCIVTLEVCLLEIFNVARKAYHSTRRHCSHARAVFIGLLCLLIRGAAKLVIRMQPFYQEHLVYVPRRSWTELGETTAARFWQSSMLNTRVIQVQFASRRKIDWTPDGAFAPPIRGDLLRKTLSRSTRHRCWRAHATFIQVLCLLVRSAAKLVIRTQVLFSNWLVEDPRDCWGVMR
jgi:hypothetical protein